MNPAMKRLRQGPPGITADCVSRVVLIALLISTMTVNARADGGTVLFQRTIGSHLVTTFTAQSPLRIGETDISVLVERVGDLRPVLDARVFIELVNEAGTTVSGEATHSQARNKLLYCSLINIPEAGHWKLKIIVSQDGQRVELLDHLMVAKAQPMLFAYWKLLVFPPLIMLLFIINQWLGRNQRLRKRTVLR